MLRLSKPSLSGRIWPASVAALLWALAAAVGVLWVLHAPQTSAPAPAVAAQPPRSAPGVHHDEVARALGQVKATSAPLAPSRFVLLGVIAADSRHGSALIAADGQPAKAFVPGQQVAPGWTLQSLSGRQAVLGQAETSAELTLNLAK